MRTNFQFQLNKVATLRRAFLVQKWMDMKTNTKNFTHRRRRRRRRRRRASSMTDNDLFFYNNSISRSPKPSCVRPKPTKTEQPISPGRRITSFLHSIFTNVHLHLKKPKEYLKTVKIERTSHSHDHQSTCSSASSHTRSCLSKNSPRSREKINNGVRRTVRFYPMSVIIDEDRCPCGEKLICGEPDLMKVNATTLMCGNRFGDSDDDDDIPSDVSSDLFELDHLSIMNECDELPVYGTT
ncbi:protein BIG GRAIN 1-like A [Bidens hawaiensis]|uniref:protein BIG GRAIN 1-like A n=1 Tax=Bidens hawaiensis TaxID=980011 RepID=UPI00404A6FEF